MHETRKDQNQTVDSVTTATEFVEDVVQSPEEKKVESEFPFLDLPNFDTFLPGKTVDEKIFRIKELRYSQIPELLTVLAQLIPESELPYQEYEKFAEQLRITKEIIVISHNDGDGVTTAAVYFALMKVLNPGAVIHYYPSPTGWSVKQWKFFFNRHLDALKSSDTLSILDLNDTAIVTAITQVCDEQDIAVPVFIRADHHQKNVQTIKHFTACVVPEEVPSGSKEKKEPIDASSLLMRTIYDVARKKYNLPEIPFVVDLLSLIGLLADKKHLEQKETNPLAKWAEDVVTSEQGKIKKGFRILDIPISNIVSYLNTYSITPIFADELEQYQLKVKTAINALLNTPEKHWNHSYFIKIFERYELNRNISSWFLEYTNLLAEYIGELNAPIRKRYSDVPQKEIEQHRDDESGIEYTAKYIDSPRGKRIIYKLDLTKQNQDIPLLDGEEMIWKSLYSMVNAYVENKGFKDTIVDIHFHCIRPDEFGNTVIISRVGRINANAFYSAKNIAKLNPFAGGHEARAGSTVEQKAPGKLRQRIIERIAGTGIDFLPGTGGYVLPTSEGLADLQLQLPVTQISSYEELEQLYIKRADAALSIDDWLLVQN